MKTKIAFVVTLAFGILSFAFAQTDPSVKIIPTAQDGILKLVYGYPYSQSVEVKFYNQDGMLATDRINAKEEQKGFIKRYDLRQLSTGVYRVEVSTSQLSVTYKLVGKKGTKWSAELEKSSVNYLTAASR
jgi:hypothetical protein